ncbi:hypothetical protein [Hydrogenovibrio sp. JE_KL2]|uniref:hypothetical protein n=1 Tax=Hydrogenovibrio sp. JE_KL2 TaxID=2651188 RepID=UPI0015621D14|nr:hypothetical protein [Hydrogenovibrio sp. JE_KL2]
MHSIGMEEVTSALGIMFGLLIASIIIVGGSVWWLYRVFKNKDDIEEEMADKTKED